MRITFQSKANRRRAKRAGIELGQTLAAVSQMALLCPSGLDAWVQRELTAGFEPARDPAAPRR
jgi:hypothetical protein